MSKIENNTIKKDDYELKNILEKYKKEISNPLLIIYWDNYVCIYNKIPEKLNSFFLKEIRMFGEEGELYIWKEKENFKYRWKYEKNNDNEEIYEEEHYMWGTKIKDNNKILSEEGKGIEVNFDFDISKYNPPFKYKVKNYYVFDEDGLIRFKDARLVKIIDSNKKCIN